MNTFEQSFAAEFEKIALSKTNIINAPTGKPRTFKSELGDLLTMGVGGGLGALAGGGLEGALNISGVSPEEAKIVGGALGAGLGLTPRYFKRQNETLKDMGVENKFSRLGAGALGATGGGLLAGLAGLLAAKGGGEIDQESLLEKLKPALTPASAGAALGGLLGVNHPSLFGMRETSIPTKLKDKLKALISRK